MWSGLQRIDILVDELAPFDSFLLDPDIRYYMTGDILDNKFSNLIKFGNEKSRAYCSLMEIIKLQSFLQSKDKTYYFMSYVNYWNDKDHLINRNFGIYKYPILETLSNLIDFSRFIFEKIMSVCMNMHSNTIVLHPITFTQDSMLLKNGHWK